MELNSILRKSGQIATIKTARPLKMKKGAPAVTKISQFQCRIGVEYDNIASVQEKRQNGELPAENAGLPWGEWHIFPHVIAHKGEMYIRCTMLRNGYIPKTVFLDAHGNEITKEEAMLFALASEKGGVKDDNDVFNIKLSSIIEFK